MRSAIIGRSINNHGFCCLHAIGRDHKYVIPHGSHGQILQVSFLQGLEEAGGRADARNAILDGMLGAEFVAPVVVGGMLGIAVFAHKVMIATIAVDSHLLLEPCIVIAERDASAAFDALIMLVVA